MSKPTSSFGVKVQGNFSLFKGADGFIMAVNEETMEAVGTLVPKDYGALFHMMIPLAVYHQKKLGLENPTPDDVSEVYKRVVNKLGLSLKEVVKEAVQEVLEHPGYEPEEPWDYTKVVPRVGHGVMYAKVSEDTPFPQEDKPDENSEEETNGSSPEGDDDLPGSSE